MDLERRTFPVGQSIHADMKIPSVLRTVLGHHKIRIKIRVILF